MGWRAEKAKENYSVACWQNIALKWKIQIVHVVNTSQHLQLNKEWPVMDMPWTVFFKLP